jgi:hypothetical protein
MTKASYDQVVAVFKLLMKVDREGPGFLDSVEADQLVLDVVRAAP